MLKNNENKNKMLVLRPVLKNTINTVFNKEKFRKMRRRPQIIPESYDKIKINDTTFYVISVN